MTDRASPHPFSSIPDPDPSKVRSGVPFALPLSLHDPMQHHPGINDGDDEAIVMFSPAYGLSGIRGDTHETCLARAEYIVRATNCHADLLAALKTIAAPFEVVSDAEMLRRFNSPYYNSREYSVAILARAAIAQAEGRS